MGEGEVKPIAIVSRSILKCSLLCETLPKNQIVKTTVVKSQLDCYAAGTRTGSITERKVQVHFHCDLFFSLTEHTIDRCGEIFTQVGEKWYEVEFDTSFNSFLCACVLGWAISVARRHAKLISRLGLGRAVVCDELLQAGQRSAFSDGAAVPHPHSHPSVVVSPASHRLQIPRVLLEEQDNLAHLRWSAIWKRWVPLAAYPPVTASVSRREVREQVQGCPSRPIDALASR